MQAIYKQEGVSIDHTPASAISAGDVVIVNGVPYIAKRDIAANETGALDCEGVFDIVKITGAIAKGDDVYWDAVGNPVGGTAGTGASTLTPVSTGVYYLGTCVLAAGSSDTTVRVKLVEVRRKRLAVLAVTPAGSAQGDAAATIEGFNVVTGADATKGVILPAALAGMQVLIKNVTAAVLKVYPASGDAINALSANASLNIAASTSVLLTALDTTTWYSLPLLPS